MPLIRVFAVATGNAFEFYDFLTFSFFSVQVGRSFFPGGPGSQGLLFALATFGVGFLTRPLGALVIGRLGDRAGRKPAMLLSFALMGASVGVLALIPPYARIGVSAPVLLVLCRLVQGFALGGEVGPSTAFLLEAAPPRRRGLYVSLQWMTQDFAVLAAGVVGFCVSVFLSPEALDAWGWRLAFLGGALVIPAGLWMSWALPDPREGGAHGPPPATLGRPGARTYALALVMLAASGVYIFGLDYMTTFVQDSLHMSARAAFAATIVVGGAAMAADPLSGLLCDRVGRKPVMTGAVFFLILAVVPAFFAMIHARSLIMVLAVSALLAGMQAFLTGPVLITVSETLPTRSRSGDLALLYAFSISVFGGTTQFVVKGLAELTRSALAPAWYMTAALVLGALAMMSVQETRGTEAPRTALRP
jgi:MFS family permease